MRKSIFTLAALMIATATASAQMTSPVELPVELNRFNMMTVKLSAPGQPEGLFIIDLGGGSEVLSGKYGAKLKQGSAGHFTGFRMTGEKLEGERVKITPIKVGPITTAADAGIWRGLDADGVDGIISARAFENAPVTLDFINKKLVFETPESLEQRARHGVSVPLKTDNFRGIVLDVFADFDFGNGQTGTCEIDTGQQNIDLNARYMSAFGISKDSDDVKETRLPGTAEVFYRATLPTSVTAVNAKEIALEKPPVTFGNYIYDCVIGTRYWSKTVMTLDIPHHRLILTAPTAQNTASTAK